MAATTQAEKFFYENAGYSRSPHESVAKARARSARALARAERYATDHGWEYFTEEDPDGWDTLGEVPREEVEEVLVMDLKDSGGRRLGSLGGILIGRDSAANRRYLRVIKAELALEAMPRARR